MKKGTHKLITLLLLAAICVSLSGCGSFQVQMAKTAQKMADLKSFHVEVTSEPKLLVNVGGQDLTLDTVVTGGIDVNTSPPLMCTDLTMEVYGIDIPLRYYIQKTDEGWKAVSWGKDSEPEVFTFGKPSEGEMPSKLKIMAGFVKLADYFIGPEADTVNGEDASRYEGSIPADDLNTALSVFNMDLPQLTEDQPFILWINGDDMLVRLDMNLAPFIGNVVDAAVLRVLEKYGLAGMDITMEIREMQTQFVFSRFDEVPELSFPG